MQRARLWVLGVVVAAVLVGLANPAGAQDGDPGGVYVDGDTDPKTEVLDPGDPGDPGDPAVAADAAVLGAGQQRSSSLPVTGGDVVALTALAMTAVVIGTLLVLAQRRRRPAQVAATRD